ncbi:MAG: nuclear transport factor 2 family protein [Alteromonadaceae bacterium]|nr:nuclear transport factor 2 family protein [Alteromonadaceae bacterium]
MKTLSLTITFILLLIISPFALATTANEQIEEVLMNYINGTSYSHTAQIEKAFHPQANLLLEKKDTPFWRVPIKEYISWFSDKKPGEFTGRIGEILSIDVDGRVASAKVEIFFPKRKIRYVDMFLLKNISGQWQIISKTAARTEAINHGKRILFIVSNAHFHGKSNKAAGVSFSEIIKAHQAFKLAGYTVDFVSPKGGAIPLSYINTSDPDESPRNKTNKQI